jgi:alanine racemase
VQKVIAKIYIQHIQENAKAFKSYAGVKLCAVVKADAYGHGAQEIACALSGIADCFSVALLDEAIAIRTAVCGKDILILTPPNSQEEVLSAAKNRFIITVPDYQTARLVMQTAVRYRVRVRVHLKANTGMNRYGANANWLGRICKSLRACDLVVVEGLYSHIYASDELGARAARARFLQMKKVCLRYYKNLICHLSATYATTLGKDFAFDMVRVGLGLYGYLPKGARDIGARLKRGMQVYAPVVATHRYSFGGAGYSSPLVSLKKGDPLSVVRYGYADGFLRTKNNGLCESGNHANHLCMDACVLKAKRKKGTILAVMTNAEKVAKATGTIVYEVLCAATRRAERRYVYEEIRDDNKRRCNKNATQGKLAGIYEKAPRRQ